MKKLLILTLATSILTGTGLMHGMEEEENEGPVCTYERLVGSQETPSSPEEYQSVLFPTAESYRGALESVVQIMYWQERDHQLLCTPGPCIMDPVYLCRRKQDAFSEELNIKFNENSQHWPAQYDDSALFADCARVDSMLKLLKLTYPTVLYQGYGQEKDEIPNIKIHHQKKSLRNLFVKKYFRNDTENYILKMRQRPHLVQTAHQENKFILDEIAAQSYISEEKKLSYHERENDPQKTAKITEETLNRLFTILGKEKELTEQETMAHLERQWLEHRTAKLRETNTEKECEGETSSFAEMVSYNSSSIPPELDDEDDQIN